MNLWLRTRGSTSAFCSISLSHFANVFTTRYYVSSYGLSRQTAAHDDDSKEELPIDPAEAVDPPFLIPCNIPLSAEANI